jgi:CRISPR associated protein
VLHQTILHLNPDQHNAKRLLEQPYRIHHMLEDINPSRQRVQWRLSSNRLLMRHEKPLDWTRLDKLHPMLGDRTHSTMNPTLVAGSIFFFDVLAFIRRRPIQGKWVIQQPQQYLEWLERVSLEHGFRVLEVEPKRMLSYFVRTSSMSIQICPVELMGQLQVQDSEAFEKILVDGLGRMKAFGCGLVLLKIC